MDTETDPKPQLEPHRRQPGETVDEYEDRVAVIVAEHNRHLREGTGPFAPKPPEPISVRHMKPDEYRAARANAIKPPPRPVLPPVMGGRLARDLSPAELADALAQIKGGYRR